MGMNTTAVAYSSSNESVLGNII